jgi:maltose/moltooligosaccharide transporter
MEPFRALVADNLPESQRTLGFSVQTFLIGLGAVIGSKLPDFLAKRGISMDAGADAVANNIKYAFYIGAAVFIVAILITFFFSKEYPPAQYEAYHGKPAEVREDGGSSITKSGKKFFKEIVNDFAKMPVTMRQLGQVQFFSWFALFSMWVFTTDAVATHVYGLQGEYEKTVAYNEAGNKVGDAFGTYNLVAMFYALALPLLAKYIGRKTTHAVSLAAGGLGLISIYFIKDIQFLHFSMIGVGLAWASILAMPYVILSGSIPPGKLGVYMGIFNFFITLPQIINGLVGGSIVKYFYGGQTIYAIVMAGIFLLVAAISVLWVKDVGASSIQREKINIT